MKTPTSLIRVSFATFVLAVAATGVHAQITLTNPGPSRGADVAMNNFAGGTSYGNQWVGALSLSANGGSPFWAYCIDPKTGVGFPSGSIYTAASLASFMSDVSGYQGQMQSSGYTAAMASGGYGYQSNTAVVSSRLQSLFSYAYADSLSSAAKAAAFGYVVWEIMGSSTSVSLARTGSGLATAGSDGTVSNFTATTGDSLERGIDQLITAINTNTAAGWASIGLTTATNYIYTVYYDAAPHHSQNFITVRTVALPGTLAMVGLALFGMGLLRRRNA